jgi:hypothetical protein
MCGEICRSWSDEREEFGRPKPHRLDRNFKIVRKSAHYTVEKMPASQPPKQPAMKALPSTGTKIVTEQPVSGSSSLSCHPVSFLAATQVQ